MKAQVEMRGLREIRYGTCGSEFSTVRECEAQQLELFTGGTTNFGKCGCVLGYFSATISHAHRRIVGIKEHHR
jgi:hypothetical protein